jgi:hypothetical protein
MEIEDFQDLIRLLQARPEWRADLRRVVLTDELLALPEQVACLQAETDRRFHELAEAQRRTEERVAALAEAQNRINEQIAALTRVVYALTEDVRVLKIDIGDLKDDNLERRYREKAPAYFGRLVRRMHVLSAREGCDGPSRAAHSSEARLADHRRAGRVPAICGTAFLNADFHGAKLCNIAGQDFPS